MHALGRERGEEGFALATALLCLFLLAVGLALVGESLALRMRLVQQESRAVTLSALSDAAVAELMAGLSLDANFAGKGEHGFGGGTIASNVRRLGPTTYQAVAAATYAGRQRSVGVAIRRDVNGVRVVRWWRISGT